jgi:hypothetical protein
MNVEERDGSAERRVLAASLVDDGVCAAVAARWAPGGLYRSRWANVVGGWAADYCKRHRRAPKRDVRSLFAAWARTADEPTVRLVESFLESISDEFSGADVNAGHAIDEAGRHFNEVRLEATLSEARGLAERGDHDRAWELLAKANKVQLGRGVGVDVLTDDEALSAAMSSDASEPLFRYPGAAGEFFDVPDCFSRDCLVAFAGPKGRGKSFWLIDAAWRAMEQRRRVAFFAIGDMSQPQMMKRFAARAARRPVRPGEYRTPASVRYEGKDLRVEHVMERCEERLTKEQAKAAFARTVRESVKSGRSYLKLSCHPTKSVSVAGIASLLEEWARGGWVCDAVVIDYSDLLAPLNSREDNRDAINSSWVAMRALSQTMHCLVLTATQTKATSYYADLITRDHFADDRRKLDHAHAFVGLNQTHDEKAEGVTRLNFFALREGDYDERKCVTCAGSLAIANPCLRSCW